MRLDEIEWEYQGNSVQVGMTWHGQGASVFMLPALSSISPRSEMWPLQERLGSWFTTLAIDWVGFDQRGPSAPVEVVARNLSELSGVSADRRCASAICNNRRRTCRSLLSRRCRGAARLDRASLPDCSNMARTIADDDGQKTPNVCSRSAAWLIGL